ncbi:hypothetical protein [Halomonas sp. H10-9-1]|uniref:PA3496 family putative envelope integrity protein n=1 Tax=Halomonas sp. H10-9-1 TaxID=2950871 RepID=UPI0032E028BC
MHDAERLTSLKSELLDIFMSMEVQEHQQRARTAAQRHLRARRGIELHEEFKQLTQEIAELAEEEMTDDAMH